MIEQRRFRSRTAAWNSEGPFILRQQNSNFDDPGDDKDLHQARIGVCIFRLRYGQSFEPDKNVRMKTSYNKMKSEMKLTTSCH